MALSRHVHWKKASFFTGYWPSHASRMSFLTEFDWGKHVFVNYDWDLGQKVDLLINVTLSRLMFWANGLIYSGKAWYRKAKEEEPAGKEKKCHNHKESWTKTSTNVIPGPTRSRHITEKKSLHCHHFHEPDDQLTKTLADLLACPKAHIPMTSKQPATYNTNHACQKIKKELQKCINHSIHEMYTTVQDRKSVV